MILKSVGVRNPFTFFPLHILCISQYQENNSSKGQLVGILLNTCSVFVEHDFAHVLGH